MNLHFSPSLSNEAYFLGRNFCLNIQVLKTIYSKEDLQTLSDKPLSSFLKSKDPNDSGISKENLDKLSWEGNTRGYKFS